jgi:hypothetical protein
MPDKDGSDSGDGAGDGGCGSGVCRRMLVLYNILGSRDPTVHLAPQKLPRPHARVAAGVERRGAVAVFLAVAAVGGGALHCQAR